MAAVAQEITEVHLFSNRDAPAFDLRDSVAVGNDVRLRLRPKRKN